MISGGACNISTITMKKQTLIFCLALLPISICKPRTKRQMHRQAAPATRIMGLLMIMTTPSTRAVILQKLRSFSKVIKWSILSKILQLIEVAKKLLISKRAHMLQNLHNSATIKRYSISWKKWTRQQRSLILRVASMIRLMDFPIAIIGHRLWMSRNLPRKQWRIVSLEKSFKLNFLP